MSTPHSDARPPRWAEAILCMLLKPENRESVSGDLLEEYRDAIVPTRGRAADLWYIRQVAWYLLRASWMWGTLMGAALVFRYLLDTLVPLADYWMRATVLSWACECGARSVPRGKYCRRSRLVFSFDPRCHGLCGSQK